MIKSKSSIKFRCSYHPAVIATFQPHLQPTFVDKIVIMTLFFRNILARSLSVLWYEVISTEIWIFIEDLIYHWLSTPSLMCYKIISENAILPSDDSILHLNFFTWLWTVFTCSVRVPFAENIELQSLQLNGFLLSLADSSM